MKVNTKAISLAGAQPRERPILFSAPMIRALLAGTKTQTRRLLKPQPVQWGSDFEWKVSKHTAVVTRDLATSEGVLVRCPYGEPGDRLWVRETFTHIRGNGIRTWYRADGEPTDRDGNVLSTRPCEPRWAPSIHMPRRESRITLELTSVRVERIQETSAADILAEGVVARPHEVPGLGRCPVSAFDGVCYPDLLSLWRAGWDSINGKRAPFASNPWVWVLSFKRIEVANG